jgi:hypothetical protein
MPSPRTALNPFLSQPYPYTSSKRWRRRQTTIGTMVDGSQTQASNRRIMAEVDKKDKELANSRWNLYMCVG